MKYTFLGLFLAMLSFSTTAETKCSPNLTGFDICQQAQKIVNEVRPLLPMRLDDSMALEMLSINSDDNRLTAKIRMSMTEEQMLDAAFKNHLKPGVVKTRMSDLVMQQVCNRKNPLRSFIRLGGEVSYIYSHPSGQVYNTVNITSCPDLPD